MFVKKNLIVHLYVFDWRNMRLPSCGIMRVCAKKLCGYMWHVLVPMHKMTLPCWGNQRQWRAYAGTSTIYAIWRGVNIRTPPPTWCFAKHRPCVTAWLRANAAAPTMCANIGHLQQCEWFASDVAWNTCASAKIKKIPTPPCVPP